MNRNAFLKTLPALGVLGGTASSLAQELEPITLVKPQTEGGKSVLAAHFHNCDKGNTPGEFKLRPDQRVLSAQTAGYPAESEG